MAKDINSFASADQPIQVHDFAEALRAQAISSGKSQEIQGVDDKALVQNFMLHIGPNIPQWAPLIQNKSLKFSMSAPVAQATPEPVPTDNGSQAPPPPAPTGPPQQAPKSGAPSREQVDQAKQGYSAGAIWDRMTTSIPKRLGLGSMQEYEAKKHADKRAQFGVQTDGPITPGNIDLKNRPVVKNADGTSSTVLTTTIGENGKTILLPLIVDGKKVDVKTATDHYHKTGEHMGIFKTEEDAEAYDQDLHNKMGWDGPKGGAQDKWQHSGSTGGDKNGGGEKKGDAVSKKERFVDQSIEELAGLGDQLMSPVGLMTAGLGPEIRAASKLKGSGVLLRALKIPERITRLGFAGMQAMNAIHAWTEWAEDPTPENAAKATVAIGAGAAAAAPTVAEIPGKIGSAVETAKRVPDAVKAGAEGFKKGAAEARNAPPAPSGPLKAPWRSEPPPESPTHNGRPVQLQEDGTPLTYTDTKAPEPTGPPTPKKAPKARAEKAPSEEIKPQGDESMMDFKNRLFKAKDGKFFLKTGNVTKPFTNEEVVDLYTKGVDTDSEAGPAAAEPEKAPAEKSGPRLPTNLAGAKPTYYLGKRGVTPEFQSDLDKAAYISAGEKKSASDAEYVKWATQVSGLTEAELRMRGRRLRDDVMKPLAAKAAHGDTIQIPETIKPIEKTEPVPVPEEPKATAGSAPEKDQQAAAPVSAPANEPKPKEAAPAATPKPSPKAAAPKAEAKPAAAAPKATSTAPSVKGMSVSQRKVVAEVTKRGTNGRLLSPEERTALIDDKAADLDLDRKQIDQIKDHFNKVAEEQSQAILSKLKKTSHPPAAAASAKAEPAPVRTTPVSAGPSEPLPNKGSKVVKGDEEYTYLGKSGSKHMLRDSAGSVETLDISDAEFARDYSSAAAAKARTATKTTPPPTKPAEAAKSVVPREAVAAKAAEGLQKHIDSIVRDDDRHYPIEVHFLDESGKEVSQDLIAGPDDLEEAQGSIAEELKKHPGVSQIKYSGPGGKSTAFIDSYRRDIIKESKERGEGYEPGRPK